MVAAVPEVVVVAVAAEVAVGAGRNKANRIDQSAYGCFKKERFYTV